MIRPDLIKILCCPETHQSLEAADKALIEKLNQQASAGTLRNRAGAAIQDKIDGGFVRADKKFLYPIRNNLPLMLVDEAIPLD